MGTDDSSDIPSPAHTDLHISELDLQAIIQDLLQGSEHFQSENIHPDTAQKTTTGEYLADGDEISIGFGEPQATFPSAAGNVEPTTAQMCEFMPDPCEYGDNSTSLSLMANSPVALVPPSPTNYPQSPIGLLDIDLIEKSLIDQQNIGDCAVEDNALWADNGWHDTFTDLFNSAF